MAKGGGVSVDKSREEFEQEYRRARSNLADRELGLMLEWYNHGDEDEPDWGYYSLDARDAWEWWQASRKALVVTVPDKVMEEDEFDKGHNCAIGYCVETIQAAGITVKGEGDAS